MTRLHLAHGRASGRAASRVMKASQLPCVWSAAIVAFKNMRSLWKLCLRMTCAIRGSDDVLVSLLFQYVGSNGVLVWDGDEFSQDSVAPESWHMQDRLTQLFAV